MANYIIAAAFSGIMILIASLISVSINYRTNHKDIVIRKVWFWALAAATPFLYFLIATFALSPDPNVDYMAYTQHKREMPISMVITFVTYLIIGVILSKYIFIKGKIGNWF